MTVERPSRNNRALRGGVLIEAAFSAVVILLLVVGIIDLGRLVHSYLVLSQAANEAARLGTRVMRLPRGAAPVDCTVNWDPPNSSCAVITGNSHDEIFARALMIIDRFGELDVHNVKLSTRYPDPGARDTTSDPITVTVDAEYNSFFSIFSGTKIHVSHTSEYLHP